jgi:hypothetical protein
MEKFKTQRQAPPATQRCKKDQLCLEKKRVQRKNTFATNLPAHHMRGKQNEVQEAEGEGPGPLAPEAAQK